MNGGLDGEEAKNNIKMEGTGDDGMADRDNDGAGRGGSNRMGNNRNQPQRRLSLEEYET